MPGGLAALNLPRLMWKTQRRRTGDVDEPRPHGYWPSTASSSGRWVGGRQRALVASTRLSPATSNERLESAASCSTPWTSGCLVHLGDFGWQQMQARPRLSARRWRGCVGRPTAVSALIAAQLKQPRPADPATAGRRTPSRCSSSITRGRNGYAAAGSNPVVLPAPCRFCWVPPGQAASCPFPPTIRAPASLQHIVPLVGESIHGNFPSTHLQNSPN